MFIFVTRNALTKRLWMQITFFFDHATHLKVSHKEYIMPTLLYCKFTTFHMLFFMPDVKVSEEIETSTPSSIEEKKTKGFLFSVTIIHLLEQGMMLQQYT